MDTTGLSALDEIVADFQRAGTRVVVCEVRANVLEKLKRAGILSRLGATGVYATLAEYSARQDSSSSVSAQ
jgi:SulP family sulfate permease